MPATLTGAKKLSALSWQPYKPAPKPPKPPPPPPQASILPNENNVYGVAKAGGKGDPPGLSFLGVLKTPQLCAAACNTTAQCMSWTWHPDTPAMKDFKLNCFGRTTDVWAPKPEAGIYSGQSARAPAPGPAPSPPPAPYSSNAWVAHGCLPRAAGWFRGLRAESRGQARHSGPLPECRPGDGVVLPTMGG